MSEIRILIRLLRMYEYFPRNREFGSALSKLRNFGGGFDPLPPRYATKLFCTVQWTSIKLCAFVGLNCNNMYINYIIKKVNPSHSNLHHATGSKCKPVQHDVHTRLKALDIFIFQKLIVFPTSWLYKCCSIYLISLPRVWIVVMHRN
jgi:hypothetical protein